MELGRRFCGERLVRAFLVVLADESVEAALLLEGASPCGRYEDARQSPKRATRDIAPFAGRLIPRKIGKTELPALFKKNLFRQFAHQEPGLQGFHLLKADELLEFIGRGGRRGESCGSM